MTIKQLFTIFLACFTGSFLGHWFMELTGPIASGIIILALVGLCIFLVKRYGKDEEKDAEDFGP